MDAWALMMSSAAHNLFNVCLWALKKESYQNFIPKTIYERFGITNLSKITYEIGHASTAMPLSLHVSTNLGCLVSEYLLPFNF